MTKLKFPFRLAPGKLVVLEGLDGTGKSTQMERLERGVYGDVAMFEPKPVFTHSPSGHSPVGRAVYELTERDAVTTPLGRQLLHLAAHAEEYANTINPALARTSVFMDRCWWSTLAYQAQVAVPSVLWEQVVRLPAGSLMPDLVFLFMKPWVEDRHNTPEVVASYQALAERYKDTTVLVPRGNPAEQTLFILDTMAERGLYWNEG